MIGGFTYKHNLFCDPNSIDLIVSVLAKSGVCHHSLRLVTLVQVVHLDDERVVGPYRFGQLKRDKIVNVKYALLRRNLLI